MVDPMIPDIDGSGNFLPRQPRGGSAPAFLRDPWGVLRRNFLLIGLCAGVVLGATWFYTSRMRPVYQATTTIRIDEKQSRLPTVDILQLASGNEVDTEMEMLRSRSLAESVTDSLALQLQLVAPWNERRGTIFGSIQVPHDAPPGSYVLQKESDGGFRLAVAGTDSTIIAKIPPDSVIRLGSARLKLTPLAYEYSSLEFTLASFEDAVSSLVGGTTITRRNREADLVTVAVEGVDAPLARDIANVLTARFIESRRQVQHSEARTTVSFLHAQLAKLTGELQGAEDDLRSFREREQIVSLKDEASTGVSQIAEVRAQRNALEAERVALVRLLEEVRSSSGDSRRKGSPYRQLAAFPTLLRNSAVVGLLSSLAATEASRAELHKSTSIDPDVQVLDQHSRELEQQLESITSTYLKGLGSQVAALDSSIASSERRLDQIPQRELHFARLDRKAKTLEGIVTQLQSRLKEAEIAEAVGDPSVRLVDPAILPVWPIRPNLSLNLALGLVSGLTLGFAVAFLREYRDKSVHTRRDVLFATGVPVLGLMPHMRRNGLLRGRGAAVKQIASRSSGAAGSHALPRQKQRGPDVGRLLLPGADHQGPLAEANNSLATNLAFARPDTPLQLLVVTSPSPGDGKTTTAINLAITFAKRGRKVLLVDADLRRGVVSTLLGLNRSPGLSTVLNGGIDFRTVVQKVDLQAGVQHAALFTALSASPVSPDSTCSLYVLTTGSLPDNPAALLASARAQSTLSAFREEYDTIIVDSPPVNAAGDASLLGTNSDGVLIVARAGVTASEALAFTMEQLNAVRAPVLGGILNDIDFDRDVVYDGAYRYYSYKALYTAESSEAVS